MSITNKKGLSNVVATVLIVLLALAAIAIVWSFIAPTLRNTGSSINLQEKCLNADVRPISCTMAGTTATVTLRGDAGDIFEVVAIVVSNDSSRKVGTATAPELLTTTTVDVTGIAGTAESAKATAIVSDPDDASRTLTCPESTFSVPCA